jgi:hypothetical protein
MQDVNEGETLVILLLMTPMNTPMGSLGAPYKYCATCPPMHESRMRTPLCDDTIFLIKTPMGSLGAPYYLYNINIHTLYQVSI